MAKPPKPAPKSALLPGYSEHHTGYAVDFIDESKPDTHTQTSFETTSAYQWLQQNAPAYSFEMSFPEDPNSLVSYEPWHWRYVGSLAAKALFRLQSTQSTVDSTIQSTAQP